MLTDNKEKAMSQVNIFLTEIPYFLSFISYKPIESRDRRGCLYF